MDVVPDGDDIDSAEISSFLDKLGVVKHRPFPAGSEKEKKGAAGSSKANGETEKLPKTPKQNDAASNKKIPTSEKNGMKSPVVKSSASSLKYLQAYKSRKYLLLKTGEMWREEQPSQVTSLPDAKLVSEAEKLAQRLLTDEISLYTKQRESSKRSEAHWLKTVLSSGTLTDKMAALTLLVQESPLHNLGSVDTLGTMSGKKGRRESMMAVDTLRDLFLTGLLPDDRKLRPFEQNPLSELSEITSNNIDQRDKLLLMWHFEALLKKKYAQFIKTLGDLSFDTLQATKEKAVATIHVLLSSKPEQENVLLPMLVNKLGDPAIKSKTMYLLTKLVEEHPNMIQVIVREVKQLLHRANVSSRAQYYAICFLSQLRLNQSRSALASELISIYFYFFQMYLQKGEVDNKMMSALLTGVNRAYVFAKGEKEELSQQMNAVYRIIPQVGFHTGVQALMLLYQVTDSSTSVSDRYYMSLYRKLGDPALKNSSKQAIFMNLLFKSLKRDLVDRRIKAFIKRILQVYSQQPPQVICGVLILLSQILKEKPGLIDFKHIAKGVWEDEDDEEEKFVDLPAPDEEEAVVNGTGETNKENGEEEESKGEADDGQTQQKDKEKQQGPSSWIHRVNYGGKGRSADYDPLNRNPLYCRAETECVWELQQLNRHYHPSVRLYSDMMLRGETIKYDGDPLKDFTLIRFLDRFVYKNPKKNLEQTSNAFKQFKKVRPSGVRAVPVNSEDFLKMEEKDVAEEDKFFHRYFIERARRKKDAGDDGSDAGSVSDTEFDAFLSGFEREADIGDFGDLDLDFASDKKMSKSKKGKEEVEEESEDSDEYDEDDDDEEMDVGDDELAAEFEKEMAGLAAGNDGDDDDDVDSDDDVGFDGFGADEDGIGAGDDDEEFSPDEDDELKMMMMKPSGGKRKRVLDLEPMGSTKKKKKGKGMESLFASAEEFAHLLEEDAELGNVSLGGADDVRNKDKSGVKQLKWEARQERGPQGKKRHAGGGFGGKKGSRKPGFRHGGAGAARGGGKPRQKPGKGRKAR
ncbi:CCAAT/enhancer-binding protein zeta isoform X2 [Aplysia californica]|nr:CCAAT/enhancer-binding protein zeta isoform X2 [Aplysia californica]